MFVAVTLASVLVAAPVRCGNAVLARASSHAGASLGLVDRPPPGPGLDSATLPLRVHGTATTAMATMERALAAAEDAWRLQVDTAGFPPPLPDDRGFPDDGGDARLDIYLGPVLPGVGAVTVGGEDPDPADGRSTRPAFLRISDALDDDALVVTTHHEFHHAVQFAVDARESPMWSEATAVAWELRARPDVDAWQDALPSFQRQPQAPVVTDSVAFAPFATDDGGLYEYGAALFALYLDHVVGDDDGVLWRELWQASVQPDAAGDVVDANEPDWLDALTQRLASARAGDPTAPSWPDLVLEFAAWRAFTGSRVVVDDGPPAEWALDGRATLATQALRLDALTGVERATTMAEGPFVLGCATWGGTAAVDDAVPLRVEARSEDGHPLGIAVAVLTPAGDGPRSAARSRSDVATAVAVDVDVPADHAVVIAVCDVAVADADAAPAFAPVRIRFARRDAPQGEGEGEGDAGTGEGEGEPAACDPAVVDCGCACQQGPSSSDAGSPQSMRQTIGVLGFAVGILGVTVRGWRSWRRRRLYRAPPRQSGAGAPRT